MDLFTACFIKTSCKDLEWTPFFHGNIGEELLLVKGYLDHLGFKNKPIGNLWKDLSEVNGGLMTWLNFEQLLLNMASFNNPGVNSLPG